jgi:hypothetical protein
MNVRPKVPGDFAAIQADGASVDSFAFAMVAKLWSPRTEDRYMYGFCKANPAHDIARLPERVDLEPRKMPMQSPSMKSTNVLQ